MPPRTTTLVPPCACALLLVAALAATARAADPPSRPRLNVLFIAVDDLNNTLGCYGHPIVKTPNVDRLASRGVRFDRAYCQYPLCNPSRTSFLSGRRPDSTQIFDNATPPRTHLGDVVMLPELFKAEGYFTARVGKVAHGAFEDAVSWDVSESNASSRDEAVQRVQAKKAARKKAEARKGADDEAGGGNRLSWIKTDNDDAGERDGATALRIAALIEEHKAGPFFIAAGFHKPHLPWVAPKKYFDMYPPDRIKLPDGPADDRDDIPPIALTRGPGDDEMTDADRRQAIASYYACTSFMDAQVGVLLDAMDRLKLWDNTVVLLVGDHGWHLGEHGGLWRKMTSFEEAARVPLIVVAPGKKAGVASSRLVEMVDIYPTLAGLCGLTPPPGLEGTSFAPLLDDPGRPWKKAAFTQVVHGRGVMGRSIRTDRFRYTEWGGDPKVAELYDHEVDAHEYTNLARDPRSAEIVAEMRRRLREGWRAALPDARPAAH
jgi:iduronate 2-sulfatase